MTQDMLAQRSSLSPDTIRRLEHGAFSPSLETLSKLCRGFDLSLSTLFTSFELGELEGSRELTDLLASLSKREVGQIIRVARALLDP